MRLLQIFRLELGGRRLAGNNPHSSDVTKALSLYRGNFGMIACFRHRKDKDREVVICNVHLYWNEESEHVKLCQAHYLCLRVEMLRKQSGKSVPVLICGDFNTRPGQLVHSYFQLGEVNIKPLQTWGSEQKKERKSLKEQGKVDWSLETRKWLSHTKLHCPFRRSLFKSAYAKCGHEKTEETIAAKNSTPKFSAVIDYIFLPSA
ncbi:LOW QUALITY PROTEIN: hypothetical protein ACHAWF_010575, partial [Thalassiosira exigua]